MATSYTADPGGFDGYTNEWDTQAVGLHASALAARNGAQPNSGVVMGGALSLAYVATTGLSATLKHGTAIVQSSDPARGAHVVTVPADQTFTHATADGTNPRNDLIVAEVNDVGTTSSYKRVRILQGTPAGTPADPTIGGSLGNGSWFPLWRVRVPAASSTLGAITDLRPWAVAAGGVTPIAGAIATPSLASLLPNYGVVWDPTAARLAVRDASTGLVDIDHRSQVKRFDLSRASVPANNSGEELAGYGYKLAFAFNSGKSTAVTPSTTLEDSNCRIIMGTSGWYRIAATVRTSTNLLAPAKTTLQWSIDNFVTYGDFNVVWTEREKTLHYFGVDEYIGAGTKLRLFCARTVSGSGGVENLGGEMTLTLLRNAT
jgi:hypothetical protein